MNRLGVRNMITILRIDVSARKERSLTRGLSGRFIDEWLKQRPSDKIVQRDIGLNPPPAVSEDWIGAAFTPEEERTKAQQATLQLSDTLIDEIESADIILLAVPMYNYGMPSSLKAWFDQIIRVNKTFTFDLARGDEPLEPTLSGKQLVVLLSRGVCGNTGITSIPIFGPVRNFWAPSMIILLQLNTRNLETSGIGNPSKTLTEPFPNWLIISLSKMG